MRTPSRVKFATLVRYASRGALWGLIAAAELPFIAGIAHAQVSETGSNSPEPVVSGSTNDYLIGNGAAGTLTINNGAQFTAGGLAAGAGGTGNGTITIDGAGTNATLHPQGATGPVDVGEWGIGTMTVSSGAVLDATDTSNCAPGWCYAFVANAAGSTGTLNITGAGSQVSLPTTTSFGVGHDAVLKNDTMGNVFGTPGASSSGTVNLNSGGTLNSGAAVIGENANLFPPPTGVTNVSTGTETSTGTVTVAGASSTWNVAAGNQNGVGLGTGPNTTGSLKITNGTVNIGADAPSSQVGLYAGGTSTHAGGSGSVLVDGGALKLTSGTDDFIVLGRNQGSATMTVQGGGTVSGAVLAQLGRDGSNGSLTVNGIGSSFTLSGGSSTSSAVALELGDADSPALAATLGPSSTGSLLIENGGNVTVKTDTQATGGIVLGLNGGVGTVTVSGIGSQLALESTVTPAAGQSGIAVGRSGSGTLNVISGGQVIVTDSGSGENATITLGGSAFQQANGEQPGTGTITVSGTGSRVDVEPAHGDLVVGNAGIGTLHVSDGGTVTSDAMILGLEQGSIGTASIDGASSSVQLNGLGVLSQTGPGLSVGAAGTGNLSISNGGRLTLTNPTTNSGRIAIGGSSNNNFAGGTGTMTVSGGSQVLASGGTNYVVVGGNGNGTLSINDGSTVDVAHGTGSTGAVYVGASPSSPAVPLSGTVTVANNSTLDAGSLLGIASDGATDSGGTGVVMLTGMSTINATDVVVGHNGVLGGHGTINGNVTDHGGIINVGASPDPLYINGDYTQNGGTINLEVDPDGNGGFLTDSLVFELGKSVAISDANIVFHFLDGASPALFASDGLFNLDSFFRVATSGGDEPLSAEYSPDSVFNNDMFSATSDRYTITSFAFDTTNGATLTQVPEPASLPLLLSAIAVFAGVGCYRAGRRDSVKSRAA
jgi:T5SS/PEP-CTERM-associated repeat protein